MSENKMYDIIIIGAGPGGMTAGIYAARSVMKTLLIEKVAAGGQINLSDKIENWPGNKEISGSDLSKKIFEHIEEYNLPYISAEVSGIEPGINFHTVHLTNGDVLTSLSVILATGGNPRQLHIPGENIYYGSGVSYCAVCDGFLFTGRTVIVVGGGDSAIEEALYLSKLAKKVYIVHRRDELRGSRILQQRLKREKKIEVLWNTLLTSILGGNEGVYGVILENKKSGEKKQIDIDGVFIFIGFEPNNQLVPAGVKMNADGYVITDERCETSIRGIFAIGDLREKYARQIITAAGDGCTAALAAANFAENKKGGEKVVK